MVAGSWWWKLRQLASCFAPIKEVQQSRGSALRDPDSGKNVASAGGGRGSVSEAHGEVAPWEAPLRITGEKCPLWPGTTEYRRTHQSWHVRVCHAVRAAQRIRSARRGSDVMGDAHPSVGTRSRRVFEVGGGEERRHWMIALNLMGDGGWAFV